MVEILIDSFQDVSKIVPVLFLVILFTNWTTGKFNKGTPFFSRLARLDVPGGALLGMIPSAVYLTNHQYLGGRILLFYSYLG